ncbi:unnamed protein product [Boreogadus saida]
MDISVTRPQDSRQSTECSRIFTEHGQRLTPCPHPSTQSRARALLLLSNQTTVPSQARRRVRGDGPEDDCLQEGRRPLGAEEVEVEDGEQEALAEREEAGDAGLQ